MLKFESAEELARLSVNCIAKGLVVRHPIELRALSDQILIRHLAQYIEEAHEGTLSELTSALVADNSPAVKAAYLEELREVFVNDIFGPVLTATAALKATLEPETRHTNPAVVTAANALFTIAFFQIQVICLSVERSSNFSPDQRKQLGLLYMIATRADEKINDILRETERQIRYLSITNPAASETPTEEISSLTPETLGVEVSAVNEREASLTGLFSFGIQPAEVADLITATLFVPGSDTPLSNASLRAYAIAYALKHYKVITLPNVSFAALIGEIWGVSVGPRRNDKGPVWDELFEPLRDDVLRMKTNAQARQRKA